MLHTQEVTGSSPVPPTPASVVSELGLTELLEALLGPEGRRRLKLRRKSNDALFSVYDADLVLRVRSTRNLENERRLLAKFHQYLNQHPPSPELAKAFLSQYANRSPRTLARYAATVKSFMKWYGEPMDNFKVRTPKSLPPYTEDSEVQKLLSAVEEKKTHKGCIVRDRLLTELALRTGMRRGELANLEARDIHFDFLVVRNGKGGKHKNWSRKEQTHLRMAQGESVLDDVSNWRYAKYRSVTKHILV